MSDLSDDLTSVGKHHGNEPPTETGQEVRAPEGPDPKADPASPAPALFQLVQDASKDWIQIRVHSARAQVSPPDEDQMEEIGQYRSVDALRNALDELSIDGRVAVFEDAEAEEVLTEDNVSSGHSWIGQPRFERITFVADENAVSDYVGGLDRSLA